MKKSIKYILTVLLLFCTIGISSGCDSPSKYDGLSDEGKQVVDIVLAYYNSWSSYNGYSCDSVRFLNEDGKIIFRTTYTTSSSKMGDVGGVNIYSYSAKHKYFEVIPDKGTLRFIKSSDYVSAGGTVFSTSDSLSEKRETIASSYLRMSQ